MKNSWHCELNAVAKVGQSICKQKLSFMINNCMGVCTRIPNGQKTKIPRKSSINI